MTQVFFIDSTVYLLDTIYISPYAKLKMGQSYLNNRVTVSGHFDIRYSFQMSDISLGVHGPFALVDRDSGRIFFDLEAHVTSTETDLFTYTVHIMGNNLGVSVLPRFHPFSVSMATIKHLIEEAIYA